MRAKSTWWEGRVTRAKKATTDWREAVSSARATWQAVKALVMRSRVSVLARPVSKVAAYKLHSSSRQYSHPSSVILSPFTPIF